MESFKEFGLPDNILHTLAHINYEKPTPIQEQAIPPALAGKDILGSAQTGTGKTAAFAIPLINHILRSKFSTALIMLPTRELAAQVTESVRAIAGKSGKIKAAMLIGGAPIGRQIQQLTNNNPRIIIGTPGRIADLLKRKNLSLANADFLVLDEMDRMLDMGFGIQIDEIIKHMPDQRQTLMFSATLPSKIVQTARKYLLAPVRIAIGSTTAVAEKVVQLAYKTDDGEKFNVLMEQLEKRNGSAIVFTKTKRNAQKVAEKLLKAGQSVGALHGDLKQGRRDAVIADFRNSKIRILVATDIAARGLDIPFIESIINYDLPQCPEDYIHRIGRTARAGADGIAINILTKHDNSKWKEICKLLDPSEVPEVVVASQTDALEDITIKPQKPAAKRSKPTIEVQSVSNHPSEKKEKYKKSWKKADTFKKQKTKKADRRSFKKNISDLKKKRKRY